jgi:hexosaminidase
MLTFLGCVRVPADGVYTFALKSDDGAVLRIGDGIVIDNDGLHEAREVRGTVALAAGWHTIELDWFNRTGDAALRLLMARTGEPLAPIPAADLAHERLAVSADQQHGDGHR